MRPRGRGADDLGVTEWEQELARIDLEALPEAARAFIQSLVAQWRREDDERPRELLSAGSAACSERSP